MLEWPCDPCVWACSAVGILAKEVANAVERQLIERSGIMDYKEEPDYGSCVGNCSIYVTGFFGDAVMMAYEAMGAAQFRLELNHPFCYGLIEQFSADRAIQCCSSEAPWQPSTAAWGQAAFQGRGNVRTYGLWAAKHANDQVIQLTAQCR
jgi:hypothetical protein